MLKSVKGIALKAGDVLTAERVIADAQAHIKEMLEGMTPLTMTSSMSAVIHFTLTYGSGGGETGTVSRSAPENILVFHPIVQAEVYKKSPFKDAFDDSYSTENYIILLEQALFKAVEKIPVDENQLVISAQDVFRETVRNTHFHVINNLDKN